jgi:hypothetical protein
MPREEASIVHRVVDAWIGRYKLGGQIVDHIKVQAVSEQRSLDVATHFSSYFPFFDFDPVAIKFGANRTICRTVLSKRFISV